MYSFVKKLRKYVLLPMVIWLLATTVYAGNSDTLSIYFAGDIMQHEAQIKSAVCSDGRYDYSKCFTYVKPYIRSADIAVGNLEVTLGGKPYRGYPAFSAPDEFLYAIRDAGFDILMTANNHCLDRGKYGLERTIKMLDSLKIFRAGTYLNNNDRIHNYPLLIEKKGFRIVFLNATYGTNGIKVVSPNIVNYIDKTQLISDILKARLMCPDVIIAYMHWGNEYQTYPDVKELKFARWLLSMGVDHVIGSHPHVIQPLEVIGDSITPRKNLIVYSLGNYISNMSASNTDGGMSVKLILKKSDKITRMIDYDYSFVWTSRPVLSGKKDFVLYPQNIDRKKMNSNEKIKMDKFVEAARRIVNAGVCD